MSQEVTRSAPKSPWAVAQSVNSSILNNFLLEKMLHSVRRYRDRNLQLQYLMLRSITDSSLVGVRVLTETVIFHGCESI
jgi:hypothetical protein